MSDTITVSGTTQSWTGPVLYGSDSGPQGNVSRTEAQSGKPYFLVKGQDREYRRYELHIYEEAQMTSLKAFLEENRFLEFTLYDLDDQQYAMGLVDPNVGVATQPYINRWNITLEMIEVP